MHLIYIQLLLLRLESLLLHTSVSESMTARNNHEPNTDPQGKEVFSKQLRVYWSKILAEEK